MNVAKSVSFPNCDAKVVLIFETASVEEFFFEKIYLFVLLRKSLFRVIIRYVLIYIDLKNMM